MPVETEFVLLAEPTVYCCEILLHCYHLIDAWNNMLEIWCQKVSTITFTCYYLYAFYIPPFSRFYFHAIFQQNSH